MHSGFGCARMPGMERIAFYGKGGIGKSTVAAGVSFALSQQGKRVLHVGCDPKHDSTLALVAEDQATTAIDQIFQRPTGSLRREHLIMEGKQGIHCIESGGPQSGVGCGGRAVSRMFEVFEEIGVLDEERYDVAVFDVLGDVVCGGFAAPLRSAFAPKVVIVVSEEMMAAYAANNITRAVVHYLDNGVCLAGLVVNLRDNKADLSPIERLAKSLRTRVLCVIPRAPQIQQAEMQSKSVLETAPNTKAAREIRKLADELVTLDPSTCPPPTPLEFQDVRRVMQG